MVTLVGSTCTKILEGPIWGFWESGVLLGHIWALSRPCDRRAAHFYQDSSTAKEQSSSVACFTSRGLSRSNQTRLCFDTTQHCCAQ